MSALTRYIHAWLNSDIDAICEAVDDNCEIVESMGPLYKGRNTVRQWAQDWFDHGGQVNRWQVTDHVISNDYECAQWTFDCVSNGQTYSFEGASIARSLDGRLLSLYEYQRTAPIYAWSRVDVEHLNSELADIQRTRNTTRSP